MFSAMSQWVVLFHWNSVNLPNFFLQNVPRVGKRRNDAVCEFSWINMRCAYGQ